MVLSHVNHFMPIYLSQYTVIVLCCLLSVSQSDDCKSDLESPCKCVSSTYTVDLTSLGQLINGKPRFNDISANDGRKYSYSPCQSFNEPLGQTSACNNVAVCQLDGLVPIYYNVGKEFGAFSGDLQKDTLQLYYQGEDQRATTVKIFCGKSNYLEAIGETSYLNYSLILHTTEACLGGGLSTGSVLVILLFVFVLFYLVGGLLYLRFVRGAKGWEQVPNYDFWNDFPLLIKDGVVFTISGCKDKVHDTTYQEI